MEKLSDSHKTKGHCFGSLLILMCGDEKGSICGHKKREPTLGSLLVLKLVICYFFLRQTTGTIARSASAAKPALQPLEELLVALGSATAAIIGSITTPAADA